MVNVRRKILLTAFTAALSSPFLGNNTYAKTTPWITKKNTIKIGLLWSLTGHLSVIEKASLNAALFWVDAVNKLGGVGGFKIEPRIIDARSDMKAYREGALSLISDDEVIAIFGGYTSASRRAVMPLIEKHRNLFFYPTCYEGRECWQRIICTGPLANQHSKDLIPYMYYNYGPRAYFIGSNYVWPKESNRNAAKWLEDLGGQVVAESYMPLGQGDFSTILEDVKNKAPDWIFSTVVGDSDLFLRQHYRKAKFMPDKLPTASLTTSEMEVNYMGVELGEGHILSAPYFQSLDNPRNNKFVKNYLNSEYGKSGVTHYNMEETYLSFLYFHKAIEKIIEEKGESALNPTNLREACGGLTLSADESPEGVVNIDPNNFNSWLTPKIGMFNSSGQVDLLFKKKTLIKPQPFMLYPTRGTCKSDGLHLPDGDIVKSAS